MAYDRYNTVKDYYNTEVGSNSSSITDNMKIGLMHVSDYGYAAAPSNWTSALSKYEDATSTSWLYLGDYEWTISHDADNPYVAYYVRDEGPVDSSGVRDNYEVRPSFYLESSVVLTGGTGTASDPYRLA